MVKKVIILLVLFLFLLTPKAYAVTVTINNPPSSISASEFTLNVTVTGADDGKNYLRIDLFKEGKSNYFGETYNGTEWKRDTDGKNYLPIDISGGSWTGDVKGKVGTPETSYYDGQGSYKMRIRRYTASGNLSTSEDPNSSAVAVAINAPTATPTPTPTNTPAPTATPTPTPTNTPAPTATPTPTKALTPTPTKVKAATPSPSPQMMTAANTNTTIPQNQQPQPKEDVLGGVAMGGKLDELEAPKQSYNWWRLLIVMGTVIVTGTCGVFLYNNHIKERSEELNN